MELKFNLLRFTLVRGGILCIHFQLSFLLKNKKVTIYNQAVVLAKDCEVDCSAVENLLGRLKMLLLQNVKQEEAHFEAESKCENHLSGNQNASKLFEQLARNTFGPPLGATSQQSSKIIKSRFR